MLTFREIVGHRTRHEGDQRAVRWRQQVDDAEPVKARHLNIEQRQIRASARSASASFVEATPTTTTSSNCSSSASRNARAGPFIVGDDAQDSVHAARNAPALTSMTCPRVVIGALLRGLSNQWCLQKRVACASE